MSWALLRIWHVEVLSSVADRAGAYTFLRTSYAAVPARWKSLDEGELVGRLGVLLDASYAQRNHQMAQTDDPTPMWIVAFDFEWVPRADVAASGVTDAGAIVGPNMVADAIVQAADTQLAQARAAARPGIDSRPWKQTFSAWRVDDDDSWHLLKFSDRESMFDGLIFG